MKYFIIILIFIAGISIYNQKKYIQEKNQQRLDIITSYLDKYERVSAGTPLTISSVPLNAPNS